uniref:Transposase (Putative), gypsy type n=1 Tax=Tanacetum cinerariifolium TaxID=118510 RepID=A0A699HKK5_TANCI|nr:hypothetical protein [Tanacetum cinerariifolium]
MGRDTVQLETAVSTISQEYLLELTSEYGISKALHPKLPGPEDRIVDFPEGKVGVDTKNNCFFWVDERVFPTIVDWRTSAPKDSMPTENTYSPEAMRVLDTYRTPIQKQPEALLCLVGLNRRYYLGDEVYPTFLHDDDQDMDLFDLIRAPNPTKVKTGSRLRTAHEVPLLTVTANRVIEIEDPATDSSGVPSTIERSPLDFANENPSQQSTGPKYQETAAPEVLPPENMTTIGDAPEAGPAERVAATDPPAVKERRKRGHDEVDTNAPPKLGMGSIRPTLAPQAAPADVSNPDPLSFADPQSCPSADVAQSSKGAAATGDLKSENTSFASMVGSPEGVYRPEWGITNGSMLDTPEACQDLVDQVAMGSQLRLRFEQKAKLLKKSVAQVARQDKRIQARENEIKNLEALLEAEVDIKKAIEDKSAELSQELENMRALFSDLQVSNDRLSQQVSTIQEQVSGEKKLKAAFEEFKQYEDNRVEQRCAEMDARLDALSIDFDEELYPRESIELRQAFADVVSARIAKGMSEGLKHRVEHGQDKLDLEAIEAYDPKAKAKYLTALQASSQLTIPVYPEVRDPMDPWACKEEILLADAIAANVSRVKKKKKCHVVCRTHGVGSAHHARFDGVSVFVPTIVPQGLAILLANAATQTEISDEASPQLLRSSTLPMIHS